MAVTPSSSSGTGTGTDCASLFLQRKPSTRMPSPSQSPHSRKPASTRSHGKKMMCLCSPSTHLGAFRCSFHRSQRQEINRAAPVSQASVSYVRRLALANLLAIIGVDEDRVRRLKMRPVNQSKRLDSHRGASPRPSRLSAAS